MFYHGNQKDYLTKVLNYLQHSLNPELNYCGTKTRVKFTGRCLKQSSHILTHKKIVNIYYCL